MNDINPEDHAESEKQLKAIQKEKEALDEDLENGNITAREHKKGHYIHESGQSRLKFDNWL